MKYLKRFESVKSDIDYHTGVVEDVFQDIIDDYNIEKFVVDDGDYDIAGFYYCISSYPSRNSVNPTAIRLTFYNQVVFKNDVDQIDFTPPIKRLESMGYIVKFENKGNYIGNTFHVEDDRWVEIIIDFSNLLTTKPKHFNESNDSRLQNMKADIKDVFQELIDDYNMEFTKDMGSITRNDKNYWYMIFSDGPKEATIKLITAESEEFESYHEFMVRVKLLLSRLESMGYKVDYSRWSFGANITITDFDV